MTKRQARVRTAAAIKADARLVLGVPAAMAAVDDAEPLPEAAEGGTIGELWLYGAVGGWWWGFNAETVASALRALDVDTLYVRIHSPGGSAGDGVAISNLLRNHRANVVTVVDGLAASAASVIAIAGDEVVMCPGSQMMIHDASLWTGGNAAQLRRDADWIDKQSDNYAGVYAHKAGGTAAEWRAAMLANEGEGTWYSADEAVTAGLADSVGTRVAQGSPPVAPKDDLDENDAELMARIDHDLMLLEREVHPAARAVWCGAAPKIPAASAAVSHNPPTASAGGNHPTHEGSAAVAFTSEQLTTMRQELGLPETADEATIVAALSEALAEQAEAPAAPTASVPEGHIVIPEARLADLETAARAGASAAETLHAREREEFLNANATKFAPANRAAWAKEYDRNPQGTREHFASAPVIIPTAELGHAGDDKVLAEADATYAALFGDEKKES